MKRLKKSYTVKPVMVNGEWAIIFPKDIVEAFKLTEKTEVIIRPNIEKKIIELHFK